jgi:hypothetical protein
LDDALRVPSVDIANGAAQMVRLSERNQWMDCVILVGPIGEEDHDIGMAAIGVAPTAPARFRQALGDLFADWRRQLGLRLQPHHLQARLRALEAIHRKDLAEAMLADVIGPFLHEYTNLVHSMALGAASAAREAPPPLRAKLEAVRKLGQQASRAIEQFSRFQLATQPPRTPVELREAVRAGVELAQPIGARIETRLSNERVVVSSSAGALARLVAWMIRALAFSSAGQELIVVATMRQNDVVFVRVERASTDRSVGDIGPSRVGSDLGRLEASGLALATCESLAKQLDARLARHNLTGRCQGMALELDCVNRRRSG